jgi:hypothetical protein
MTTQLHASRVKAEARIEDTLFLIDCHTPLTEVVKRVGFPTVEAAAKFFYRRGMDDIACMFDTEHKRARKGAAA